MIKRLMMVMMLAHICASTGLGAEPAISVEARQRYPWNGLVDVHFTITGDAGKKYDTSFTAKDMVGNTNIAMRTIRKADGTAAANEQLLPGNYSWVWDASADLPKDWKCDRVMVTGTVEVKPLYMVIDLSSGANSSSYPVSYLDDVPSGGWSDTYKTTKLVLRRIEPGTFKMSGTYNVTLTKPFYIGVFEVTQRQYKLVTGSDSTINNKGGTRPAACVSYHNIRGSDKGAKWPSSASVDSNSFMGKLRVRTGLDYDLPTEAQWEYACRAGTTSKYNNGGDTESDLKKLGRYSSNCTDGKGGGYREHVIVGSYLPNAWELYDMHGNVQEWCLDWWKGSLSNSTDPKGPSSSADDSRVCRGGPFSSIASNCTSSSRAWGHSTIFSESNGFRLALPLSN